MVLRSPVLRLGMACPNLMSKLRQGASSPLTKLVKELENLFFSCSGDTVTFGTLHLTREDAIAGDQLLVPDSFRPHANRFCVLLEGALAMYGTRPNDAGKTMLESYVSNFGFTLHFLLIIIFC